MSGGSTYSGEDVGYGHSPWLWRSPFSSSLSSSPSLLHSTFAIFVLPSLFFGFIFFLFFLVIFVSHLALGDTHRDNVSLTRDNLRLFSVFSGGSTNNDWDLFDRLPSTYSIIDSSFGHPTLVHKWSTIHIGRPTANFDLPSAPTNFLPSLPSRRDLGGK